MSMDLRKKFFNRFALSLFAIFVINALANFFFWYQSFPRFDQMMHFFGGVSGGLFVIWFLYKKYSVYRSERNFAKIVIINSLLFLVAATLWEIMEYSVQDLFDIGNVLADKYDSINDLILGLLGNFIALIYYFSKKQNQDVRN